MQVDLSGFWVVGAAEFVFVLKEFMAVFSTVVDFYLPMSLQVCRFTPTPPNCFVPLVLYIFLWVVLALCLSWSWCSAFSPWLFRTT